MQTEVPAMIVSFGDAPANKVSTRATDLVMSVGGNHNGGVQMGSLM